MPPDARRAPAVLPPPRPGTPPRPRVPAVDRWTLDNGLRVAAVRRRGLPQLALKLVLPAGASADPAGTRGLASLTGALLTEGTERFDSDALHDRLDALGASLAVHTSHDFTHVEMLLLSETLADGLALLGDVLARPAFPAHELDRHRAELLDSLAARLDEPANVADDRAALEVFGDAHPYGHLSSGTPEGVARVSRDQVLDFHARYLRPEGAVLVAAGELEGAALRDALARALDGWRGAAEPVLQPPVPEPPAVRRVEVPWPGAAQAELRLAGLGLARTSADWIPAAVTNYLLGGSTITGRLGLNLREDKGWTYGIRSGFTAGLQPAGWGIDTAVEREVAAAALDEILTEVASLVEHGVAPGELTRAKEVMVLSLPRAFETPARIVGRIATQEAFGLGDGYWEEFPARVEAVTLEDVQRVARQYFDPSGLVRVVVG